MLPQAKRKGQRLLESFLIILLACANEASGEATCSRVVPKCVPPKLHGRHLMQTIGPGGGVPMDDLRSSYEVDEDPKQQAAITAHLEALLEGKAPTCAATDPACPANPPVPSQPPTNPPLGGPTREIPGQAAAQALASKPWKGPKSMIKQKLTFLENSQIKVGVDPERAGTISWISSPHMPGKFKNMNLVNNWDNGRLLQQSFYGCKDASCWYNRPWLWNPVQAGSWQNLNGKTTKSSKSKTLQVAGYPRNWGKEDLVQEVAMTADIGLMGKVVVVNFTMAYNGKTKHPKATQETPAVFVTRDLGVLTYYDGKKPFTNNKLTYKFPPPRNVYAFPTERWAAFIDSATGTGLGVFVPSALAGVTAYRLGPDGSDKPYDCSYFAQTIRMRLTPKQPVYKYQAFIMTGKVTEMRDTFKKLAADPKIFPKELIKIPAQYFEEDKSAEDNLIDQPDMGRRSLEGRVFLDDEDPSSAPAPAPVPAAGAAEVSPPVTGAGLEADVANLISQGPQGEGSPAPQGSKVPVKSVVAGVVVGVGVAAVGVAAALMAAKRLRATGTAAVPAPNTLSEPAAAIDEPAAAATAEADSDEGDVTAQGEDPDGEAIAAEAVLMSEGEGPRAAAAVVDE